MKFIYKIRKNSLIGIKKNKLKEYKSALRLIKISSKKGRFSCTFTTKSIYDNEDDIYFYIINRLNEKGIKSNIEHWGYNNSYKRLNIKWDE